MIRSTALLAVTLICAEGFLPSPALRAAEPSGYTRDSENRAVHQSLLLISGMQTTLDLPFEPCSVTVECIRVANKGLFEVQYSKDLHQLIFTPVRSGETTLTVRDSKGGIRLIIDAMVSNNNLPRRLDEARELLKGAKGISVSLLGDRLVIDGQANDLDTLRRTELVISDPAFRSITQYLVRPSAALLSATAKQIEAQLGDEGVKVSVAGQALLFKGNPKPKGWDDIITLAHNFSKAYGLSVLTPYHDKKDERPAPK